MPIYFIGIVITCKTFSVTNILSCPVFLLKCPMSVCTKNKNMLRCYDGGYSNSSSTGYRLIDCFGIFYASVFCFYNKTKVRWSQKLQKPCTHAHPHSGGQSTCSFSVFMCRMDAFQTLHQPIITNLILCGSRGAGACHRARVRVSPGRLLTLSELQNMSFARVVF